MAVEIILIALMTAPLIYLLAWGLANNKIGQYQHAWRELKRKWGRRKIDLVKVIKEGQGRPLNHTQVSMVRRSSIDNFIMPLNGPRDCVIQS